MYVKPISGGRRIKIDCVEDIAKCTGKSIPGTRPDLFRVFDDNNTTLFKSISADDLIIKFFGDDPKLNKRYRKAVGRTTIWAKRSRNRR